MGSGVSKPSESDFVNIISNSDSNIQLSKEEAQSILDEFMKLKDKCNRLENSFDNPPVFFSYSWKNSNQAVDLGQTEGPSVGITDPRQITSLLTERDNIISRADFLEGDSRYTKVEAFTRLRGCRAMVAFISNEYVADQDLVDEFIYARKTLNIPVIEVVVGAGWSDGWDWQKSPVGLLIAGELYIDMTNPEVIEDKITELSATLEHTLPRYTISDQLSKQEAVIKVTGPSTDRPVFLSYCWRNSKDAEERKEIGSAVGNTDPRDIHRKLKDNGFQTWLDKEELGKGGLFEDIAEGLLGANVVVACISTDYTNSENCCLEFMYSKKTLRLPVIPVIVGENSDEWKKSKIGLLLGDINPVDCTDTGMTEEKWEELQERVANILHGNKTEKDKEDLYEPDLDNLKVGDCLELYYPNNGAGDLDFGPEFNVDSQAIVGLDEGKVHLCSAYWWPVRVVKVDSPEAVTIEWLSYEGDWDQEASPDQMRPTQFTNADNVKDLQIGSKVQVKLAQKNSYAWVDGVVEEFCDNGRVQVVIDNPMSEADITNNSHYGNHIERVRVKKAAVYMLPKQD